MEKREQLQVAKEGSLTLWHRAHADSNGWKNLKLERRPKQGRKNNWWLGWNGERFCENHDFFLLRAHEPQTYSWVLDAMKKESA